MQHALTFHLITLPPLEVLELEQVRNVLAAWRDTHGPIAVEHSSHRPALIDPSGRDRETLALDATVPEAVVRDLAARLTGILPDDEVELELAAPSVEMSTRTLN